MTYEELKQQASPAPWPYDISECENPGGILLIELFAAERQNSNEYN
jgi:hypothetical protein